ncbi:MAG: hypothetical protein KDC24_03675 [Saprospiraceae bacterium]|nr:hypothetical protein [Saprospiraceae bacterium]
MRKVFWCCLIVAIPFFGKAQTPQPEIENLETIQTLEDTLAILSFAMVNDSTPVKRFASCQKFIKTLVQALKNENSFYYPFERIRTVSIIYPPDSTFRIFSWQLYVDINEYHYYGTIQMNEPELKMYPLIDRSGQVSNPESAILKKDNWYGALYYNVLPFPDSSGQYLLFGYDAFEFFNKRKFVDVLSFKTGEPVFGAPVFEKEVKKDETKIVDRFVLEYGSDAKVKLNYDKSLNMIVFDHLVLMASPYPDQDFMNVPDGDIDGMYYEDKIWKFKPRIYDQILEEPPRPAPVLDDNKKDIFGKDQKN